MSVNFTVVLTDAQAEFLRERRRCEGLTHSQVVRLALEKLRADPTISLLSPHTDVQSYDAQHEEAPA